MPWVTPRTWVKGDFPTVGRLNTDLRDNMNFLATVLGANVRYSVNQSIPNNSQTAVTYDAEDFDSDTMHNQSSLTARLTINTAGKYLVGAIAYFAAAAGNANQRMGILIRNRATVDTNMAKGHIRGIDASNNPFCYVETIDDCLVGDYWRFEVLQDSGGAINLTNNSTQGTYFFAQRICT